MDWYEHVFIIVLIPRVRSNGMQFIDIQAAIVKFNDNSYRLNRRCRKIKISLQKKKY